MDATSYLIEILEYFIFKLKRGDCTVEEAESVTDVLMNNTKLKGTIGDFAKFYNVSESNVRANIARKMVDKPERKLLYPFNKFSRLIPSNWRKK